MTIRRHLPRDNRAEDIKLRYLPDTPEQIRQSIASCGYQDKLERAVREAMTRAKRQ